MGKIKIVIPTPEQRKKYEGLIDSFFKKVAKKYRRKKHKRLIPWDFKGPKGKVVTIDLIDQFDARGLRRLYRRTDSFPGFPSHSFNMTIWKDQKDRLFARFWCRSKYIGRESYEIIGLDMEVINYCREIAPDPKSTFSDYDEIWIPECLKDAYDDWIVNADW